MAEGKLDLSDLEGIGAKGDGSEISELPNVVFFDPDQLDIQEEQVTCVICGRHLDKCEAVETDGDYNYCIGCFVKHCV